MNCVYCPIVARQLSSVQYTILQLFSVPDTASCESVLACWSLFSGHERCCQGLKWVGTHGNAVLRPTISAIRRSKASNSVFLVGIHVSKPER